MMMTIAILLIGLMLFLLPPSDGGDQPPMEAQVA